MPKTRIFSLKQRILIPYTLAFILLIIAFGYSLFLIQNFNINDEAKKQLQAAESLFFTQIANDKALLQATLETLIHNKELESAFKRKDRKALLGESLSLFDTLKKYHKITHFYYTDTDLVNLLRVHKPDKFGDKIDRFTTQRAVQTGAIFSGMELGPLGTFTLRVVAPWHEKETRKVIGFVEMGEEIGHIVQKMSEILNVSVHVVIEKKYLDQDLWAAGIRMLGNESDWNQYPGVIMTSQTTSRLPNDFIRFLDESNHKSLKTDIRTRYQNQYLQGRFIHLFDVRGRGVGDMIITFNITDKINNLQQNIFVFSVICLGVGLSLFILFFRLADKTEASFDTIHTRMIELEKDRSGFILEHLPAHISILDNSGCFTQWNRFAENTFGYNRKEASGKLRLKDLLNDPTDAEIFDATPKIGELMEGEAKGRKKNGDLLWLMIRLLRMPKNSDHPEILCVVEDITLRTIAQQALEKSEKQFRHLIETSPIGIFIARDGCINYTNASFMTMLRVSSAEDIINQPVDQIFVFDSDDQTCRFHSRSPLMKGDTENFEATMVDCNSERIDTAVWLTHMDDAGTPAILAFVIDISVEKKLRSQLIQSQKMESIGTLAGGIAHDFNNILSAIIGFTELSLANVEKGSKLQEYLGGIYQSGMRARDLVKQILTFARQTENELRPVQVSLIVREVLKLMRSTLPANIEIKSSLSSNALVNADPSHIHQLLMNLCTNAAHAMESSGKGLLEVGVEEVFVEGEKDKKTNHPAPGHYLKVWVQDTGKGIPPHLIHSIFEPYFTTKNPGEGTGLGLAIVHGVVKSCGGDVQVKSSPGKGSLFNIFLPVFQLLQAPETIPVENAELPRGSEHVMVVDDEPALCMLTRSQLENLGYRVTERTSSIEALELFKHKHKTIELVITDMTMPNMTGDVLAAEMLNIDPDIPIILCTGYSKSISRKRVQEIGIKALIMKPLDSIQLAETVRRVLDGNADTKDISD